MATASNSKLKFSVTAALEKGVAVFRMSGGIGYSESCTSEYINTLVEGFIKKGHKDALIYLNTPGGSVFDANEIINDFDKFDSVKIIGGAMVASAGTFFAAKYHTTLKKNSRFMIHKPSTGGLSGNEDQVEADLKLLKDITSEYRAAYAKKTGKTEDQIEAMWAKGDVWMTSSEALAQGFIDAIEDKEQALSSEDIAMITASTCPDKPSPIHTQNKMDKDKLIAMLGLASDATDQQIEAAIQAAKKKADDADAATKVSQSQAEQNAKALVDKAVSDKKITADQHADYLALAKSNPENTKSIFDKMPVLEAISGQLEVEAKGDKAEPAERKTWTIEDYLDKDPEALQAMETKDPERFKALNQDYFKKR